MRLRGHIERCLRRAARLRRRGRIERAEELEAEAACWLLAIEGEPPEHRTTLGVRFRVPRTGVEGNVRIRRGQVVPIKEEWKGKGGGKTFPPRHSQYRGRAREMPDWKARRCACKYCGMSRQHERDQRLRDEERWDLRQWEAALEGGER